ncbi:MAG TPA: response regulator transcription factor [Chloroflexota bacterium]|nr:response regulator transcription factor [Chloroflexota bacterium]
MSQKIKLLVAYRHSLLRQALRTALASQNDIEVVQEAADGKEAIELAEKLQPDVVVMDTQMPVVSGVEATMHIRKRVHRARVLLLTLGADDEMILNILRAGAAGCLLKDADLNELMLAIRTVHRGGSYLSPEIADRMVQNYVRFADKPGEERPRRELLSVREREILQLVAEGLGNQAIAQRLTLSVKTVEAHKAHICQKLGVRGRTELIKYAIRKGLIDLELERPIRAREREAIPA